MGWIMFVTNMDGRTIRCSDNCGNTMVCRDTSCLPSTSINVRYRPKALSPVLDRVPGTRTGTLKAPPSLSFTLSAHLAVFTRANAREVNIHTHTHGSRIRRHPSVPLLYLYSRACHFHFGASLMGLPPPPPPSSPRFRRGYVFYLRLTTLQYSRLRIPFSLFPR